MIDNAGALADQPLPHPVQGLKVELIGGLRRHELHCRPLHRFANRLRITKIVLLSLRVGSRVPRRHQPGIMPKCLKPATEMMRANAGFHADQARRHVRKSCFHLAKRPLLTQHDRAALIKANNVE